MPSSVSNGISVVNTAIGSTKHAINTDEEKPRKVAKLENHSTSSPTIEQKYRDLQLAHRNLQDELKRLQEQDFNARNKDEGPSHHVVSAQFVDVFQLSADWARDYFKIPISAFRVDEHELFKKSLSGVLCGGCHWWEKKKLNVSHLVQAVVAEVLARRILLPQFTGCSEPARHEFGQIYDAMLKENESKAHKWRATTFVAYEQCDLWKSSDPAIPPETTSKIRQNFYNEIARDIDMIVGSIARAHFPDRGDDEERFEELMVFVEAAGDLAATLARQAAKLEIIDKSWFERSQCEFLCNDSRMKGRFMEEYEESEEGFQVDIVLRPGFLKYGNDDGEDLEKYAVWIPAMLDLSEKSSYEDARETANGEMLEDNTMTPHTQPEQEPSHLLSRHTSTIEPSSEPVVPLPYQNELHPRESTEVENREIEKDRSVQNPSKEPAKPHGKSPPQVTQIGGGENLQTTPRRRRDKFWRPLKTQLKSMGTLFKRKARR